MTAEPNAPHDDAAMIAEVEAANGRMTVAPWSIDPDLRNGGADQILAPDGLTIAFMTTPTGDDDEQPIRDAEGIVLLVNNRDRLIELAKIGMKALPLLEISARALDKIADETPSHGSGGCVTGSCATCIASDARDEVVRLEKE